MTSIIACLRYAWIREANLRHIIITTVIIKGAQLEDYYSKKAPNLPMSKLPNAAHASKLSKIICRSFSCRLANPQQAALSMVAVAGRAPFRGSPPEFLAKYSKMAWPAAFELPTWVMSSVCQCMYGLKKYGSFPE